MKTNTQSKRGNSSSKKEKSTATNSTKRYLSWIIKNALALFILAFILNTFVFHEKKGNFGYHWALNKALIYNGEIIKQIKQQTKATIDERFAIKLGAGHEYFLAIKANTPEDAVILLPSREDFFPKGEQSIFQGEPYNKLWATRFLYPRRVVTHQELGETSWSEKITHVAIVNGRGYEHLDYEIAPHQQFAIVPFHRPNNNALW